MIREGKKDRYQVWVAPAMNNLPVKIMRIKGDKELEQNIRDVTWMQ